MIIEIQEHELEFVRPILRRTAKRYRQLLIHREILSGKLQELRVLVRWMQPEDIMQGFYRLDHDRGGIRHYIELHIGQRDSKKSIAHCFAHELSHMLLHGSGDYVRHLTGETQIPSCLQESMADNLADFVVSRCRFSDDTCAFMLHRMEDGYCREFAQLLARGFGSPLEDADFVDDFAVSVPAPERSEEIAQEEQCGDAFWDEYFAKCEETCAANLWVHNYFWYFSVLGRFYEIPEIFDEYMGEGAFEQVCDDMSFYHASVRSGTAPDIAQRQLCDCDDGAEQAKKRALDTVARFADIRTKEREEGNQ